jgi:transcriptional regulator GlxA family with amidase domain
VVGSVIIRSSTRYGPPGAVASPEVLAPYDGLVTSESEAVNLRLLRARNHMDRRYAEPLDVEQLAALAFMSRAHFIREFKRVFDETPYRYLQRRRVERAMFMLRHNDMSVTEVCMAVGFSSLGTFSRTFSEIVGRSPSAYREWVANEQQVAPTSFAMRWSRPVAHDR